MIMMFRFMKCRKGQGMVEYILIVALIAIIVIAGVRLFGGKVKGLFSSASDKIATEGTNAGLQTN
jgi:pilus assembly protein Flp/PilA